MKLVLNIYTDDSLTEVARVVEADKLKIPYKVAMYVIQSLDNINMNDQDDIIQFISKNIDKLDRIIKATFGISDSELEFIETTELIETAKEIYSWVLEKLQGINGGKKNELKTV